MNAKALVLVLFAGSSAFADVWVNGYCRRDGVCVQGHWRSSPNNTKADNWSTRGNYNPYNGKRGTRDDDSANTRESDDDENGSDNDE